MDRPKPPEGPDFLIGFPGLPPSADQKIFPRRKLFLVKKYLHYIKNRIYLYLTKGGKTPPTTGSKNLGDSEMTTATATILVLTGTALSILGIATALRLILSMDLAN